MKKSLIALFCLTNILLGCKNDKVAMVKVNIDPDTTATDAEQQSDEVTEESLIEEREMPSSAEMLFDDFFFNFAANKHLQMERIAFPLTVNSGYKVEEIQQSDWQMERFFMNDDVYTLIFDDESQMERMKDMTISEAIVERFYLDRDFVKQYLFSRKSGRWMLTEIRNQTLPKNPNESFIRFYHQFATDSVFQRASLNQEISYQGPDPDAEPEEMESEYEAATLDDDATMLEGFISPDLWDDFAPELPKTMLYNIVYGPLPQNTKQKILLLRGVSNGFEEELTFRQMHGKWKLTRITR